MLRRDAILYGQDLGDLLIDLMAEKRWTTGPLAKRVYEDLGLSVNSAASYISNFRNGFAWHYLVGSSRRSLHAARFSLLLSALPVDENDPIISLAVRLNRDDFTYPPSQHTRDQARRSYLEFGR